MAEASAFDQLKKDHFALLSDLQGELKKHTPAFFKSGTATVGLLNRIDDLLKRIREHAPTVKTLQEYQWLAGVNKAWHLICLGVLDAPRNVAVLEAPARYMDHVGEWSSKDIYDWVKEKAFFVAEDRLEALKSEMLAKIAGLDVDSMPGNAVQSERDWVVAEIFFAFDLLRGELGFCNCCTVSLFEALERVWLHDVMELHAYLIWKAKKEPFQAEEAARQADFYLACTRFRERLADQTVKCDYIEAYDLMKKYVADRFLDDKAFVAGRYSIDRNKVEGAIVRKAKRSYEVSRKPDKDRNYYHALEYVGLFYENIIPAMFEDGERGRQSKQKIFDAFEKSDGPDYYSSIGNCFEAAALVYLIKNLPRLS